VEFARPRKVSAPLASQDFHAHDLDAALGKRRKLGEPVLDIGRGVVCLEIVLRGEDLVEDEVARTLAVLLEEIDEVLGITPNQRDQRKRGFA